MAEISSIEAWAAKERTDALFTLRQGDNPVLKFVQVGDANRINTAFQGSLMTKLRGIFTYLGWSWGIATVDHVENYQTTCQGPHGAREMLLDAIQFTEWAGHDRNKASFNITGDGKK